MKQQGWLILAVLTVFLVTGLTEYAMGRLPLGPDGKFKLASADVWSSEQSQRFMDPYSPSHFIHGILFYGLLWIVARPIPKKWRFVMALVLEAAWEVLENSPVIIDRYRAATISLGYVGDSIINSLSDIVFAGLGFLFASKLSVRISIATIIALELFTLWWVRDNLTINIIMLIRPIEAIKEWQMQIAPPLK
jgi:hypothetical protein